MSTIIKPCPFCGGSDIDEAFVRGYKSGDQSQPVIAAGCHSCGASGPDTNVPDHSTGYKESINKWNDRAEVERLQARVAELEGQELHEFVLRYVSRPNDPYYHTRWDLATTATVQAETKKEAGQKIKSILGDPGRSREWEVMVKEIRPAQRQQAAKYNKAGGGQ